MDCPASLACRAHRTKILLQYQMADLGLERFRIDSSVTGSVLEPSPNTPVAPQELVFLLLYMVGMTANGWDNFTPSAHP